jgi:hypothetical protein
MSLEIRTHLFVALANRQLDLETLGREDRTSSDGSATLSAPPRLSRRVATRLECCPELIFLDS